MSETTSPARGGSAIVSVILPIYNAGPYLDQAISSVRNQTYRNLEIICLNDGSTDDSLATMRRHAAEDSRIVVIDKPNQGYGATCNRGISEAHGEWISIVEPDDWIEPDMYADLVSFAESFDEPVDIAKSAYWRIWMPDTKRQRKLNCSYKGRIKPPSQPFAIKDAAHLLTHHPSIWSAIYRKGFLAEKNISFREIPGAGWADNPFLIDTLCQTDRIVYLDRAYYCYREETPEKSRSFAQKSTLVPFERWNDMMDELERLEVRDESILRAHNSRGFTYLSGVIEVVGIDHPDVREAAVRMFARMDADLVFSDKELSPAYKRLFAELRGLPAPKTSSLGYLGRLFQEGVYSIRNNGVRYAGFAVRSYLEKRKARSAGR